MSKNNMQIRLFKPSFNNDEIKSIKEVFNYPGWVMVKK